MNRSTVQVNALQDIQEEMPSCVAIGSFDGVHRGHQVLIERMVYQARAAGLRTAVLTFFPHPRRVIQNLIEPYYLARLEDRVRWIAEIGVDIIVTHPFNESVRQMRAVEFVDALCAHLQLRQLWGGRFSLGRNREGDIPTLQELGRSRGYSVELMTDLTMWNQRPVSSSRIRRSLREGDMADVNGCLGRPYLLRGVVSKGEQRGRTIGFPTANIACWPEQLLPANGVYAAYAWLGDHRFPAATNVGVRPTVNGRQISVEAHLLDFDADIYGRELSLEFMERVRPEQKFDGLPALKTQIEKDVAVVRRLLRP